MDVALHPIALSLSPEPGREEPSTAPHHGRRPCPHGSEYGSSGLGNRTEWVHRRRATFLESFHKSHSNVHAHVLLPRIHDRRLLTAHAPLNMAILSLTGCSSSSVAFGPASHHRFLPGNFDALRIDDRDRKRFSQRTPPPLSKSSSLFACRVSRGCKNNGTTRPTLYASIATHEKPHTSHTPPKSPALDCEPLGISRQSSVDIPWPGPIKRRTRHLTRDWVWVLPPWQQQ
ncbi:uncharacterized protein J3D65DRAFT_354704 [Phyllosticta citribraziliensis]|uniref:Uncharacterized protein n=1 Tax=Phyllosticta citribraziliensis TaxID=989973 RepID=A0ABR1LSS3_9PEZI